MRIYVHLIYNMVLKKCSTNICTTILKETVAYYLNKGSPVLSTFLDVSKAFDRVNYYKLFRLFIRCDLPACTIRVLINMPLNVYLNALNSVKQGGVISPILFCIYIDDLLVSCLS